MSTRVEIVSAFQFNNEGGNDAGVVLGAELLSDTEKLAIANKVGLSETVFLNTDQEYFEATFYTPTTEVTFCGHATLALFSTLFESKIIRSGFYDLKTKSGIVNIKVNDDGLIFFETESYGFFEKVEVQEVSHSLHIHPSNISDTLMPIEIVQTGEKDLIVPIKNGLDRIKPNFQEVENICKKYRIAGFHLFEVMNDSSGRYFNCRNFAPLFGIPEESATGSATASLIFYLYKLKMINLDERIVCQQGRSMGKESRILCSIIKNNNKLKIQIGGECKVKGCLIIDN